MSAEGPPGKGKDGRAPDARRRLNTSKTDENMLRRAKLIQKLCKLLNCDGKDETVRVLYAQATTAFNLRKAEKSDVAAADSYGGLLRAAVKKRGRKADVGKFDAALEAARSAGQPGKLAALLHFLQEMSFTEAVGNGPPVAHQLMQQVCELADSMQDAARQQPGPSSSVSSSSVSSSSVLSSSVSTSATSVVSVPVAAATKPPDRTTRSTAPPVSVDESALVQDLIFSFQEVDGRLLKFSHIAQDYQLDPKTSVPIRHRSAVVSQSRLSLAVRGVASVAKGAGPEVGVVWQAFSGALRSELTEFYRLVANCQAELSSTQGLSLRQLALRTADARWRMRWLESVAQACVGLRGCLILSAVHGFLEHGSVQGRQLTLALLAATCVPVLHMLSRWLLDGELSDPFQEFFVAGNEDIVADRLWHEKYRVQESLVPSFMPMELAAKIVATGKSINFLREVCKDRVDLQGRAALKTALANTPVEALFTWDSGAGGELRRMMEGAFRETSARVIAVLTQEFKLTSHLQALRDLLLLGQGDFVGHLMELLEPQLDRPANDMLSHNAAAKLDEAVRTTNAQYADADVLARLDVRILQPSPGDTGWDVFSLDYHVDGPIGTVFAPTMTQYLVLFQALWKAKRIEWVLSRMWKQQATGSKMLRNIPELAPVLRQVHLLTSEMIHFVHQMQYYVLFEVIECSWEELAVAVRDATTLDDIIGAHHNFLLKVKAGAFLDPSALDLSIQLRCMYETVLQLQAQVHLLHTRAHLELKNRALRNQLIEDRGRHGEFGVTSAEEDSFREATHSFLGHVLPGVRIQVKTLAASYQNCVRKLLAMLSETGLANLQLLSFRLDFNEHYRLNAPPRRALDK